MSGDKKKTMPNKKTNNSSYSKKKPMKAKIAQLWKKSFRFRFAVILLFIVLVLYSGYEVTKIVNNPIESRTALPETVRNTLDIEYFVVRDEECLEKTVSGTLLPLVSNGERVARNEEVAAVFKSEQDASDYVKASELEKELERYEKLNSSVHASNINVTELNKSMDEVFKKYLQEIENRNMAKAAELLSDFRDKATSREIALGGDSDFSGKIQEIKTELNKLSVSGGHSSVKAQKAGFYMPTSDGYENVLSYDGIEDIAVDDIKAAISVKRNVPEKEFAGKMIYSYNWYICFSMSVEDITKNGIKENETYTVIFSDGESEKNIEATVKVMNKEAKEAAVVLSCKNINSDLLSLRKGTAKLVAEEFTGYRVPDSAVRVIKNSEGKDERGVFTITGRLIKFKKIDVVYDGEGYLISCNPEKDGVEDSSFVERYDRIVFSDTKGLYDGKIVY